MNALRCRGGAKDVHESNGHDFGVDMHTPSHSRSDRDVVHGEERTSPATQRNEHRLQSTMEAQDKCKKRRYHDEPTQKKHQPYTAMCQ